jgi:SAM-dependent methyltransferase
LKANTFIATLAMATIRRLWDVRRRMKARLVVRPVAVPDCCSESKRKPAIRHATQFDALAATHLGRHKCTGALRPPQRPVTQYAVAPRRKWVRASAALKAFCEPPITTDVPSLDQNLAVWGQGYDWSQRGDEWSDQWGGVSYQWWTTLFPRIQGFVPAGRILEIAPGYGRWTHFLKDLCDELIIVDIAEAAIAHCRERFLGETQISAFVNDGTSLRMARDESIDLVFSFDSLVHAEADIMGGYLTELSRILARDGIAFLHHSNLGAYERGTYDPNNVHWRAPSVSAAMIEQVAESVGLSAISQETVAWGNETMLNDCFSVIARLGSRWDRDNVVVEHLQFTGEEIAMARRFSTQYPPSRSEVRFGSRSSLTVDAKRSHDHALALQAGGETARARDTLRTLVRGSLDSDVLNDLAVLSMDCGDCETAVDLLRAAVRLYPDDVIAVQNLAVLLRRNAPAEGPLRGFSSREP